MATLLLSAVGTALGGPLGGALGALLGQQVDSALVGRRKIEGPRLKELSVQTSSYGTALPKHFGTIRASGSVIWATELVEHREKAGGGKSGPSVTSYTYTASFAVALASRPIAGVGRIWADGNLLRGTAGDLKVGGALRVHLGHGDQAADPLLVQAEGQDRNPAYRNLAYVVFEDLELADYGNRLPSLTFEIIADAQAVSAGDVIGGLMEEADASGLDRLSLSGFTVDQGAVSDVVSVLSEVSPISCTVRDGTLAFALAEGVPDEVAVLPLPGAGGETAEDAKADGWSRKRETLPQSQQCAVRYYDKARDYQPGLQRSIGRSAPGDVFTIELPAAMTAPEAAAVADRAARRRTLARDSLRYRITEIDQRFSPGELVSTPVAEGIWRVEQWEWQSDGVMLDLSSVLPTAPLASENAIDSGRSNPALDLVAPPTRITAFELPWDGTGDGTAPTLRVAASAETAGWRGAALFAQAGDGALSPIGTTGRRRAILGSATSVLGRGSPLLLDHAATVDVELASGDFLLDNLTWAQLVQGGNLALLGSELIQFARAERLGARMWRLSAMLRGRGGTEAAIGDHAAGEPFTLIDDRLVALDSNGVGSASQTAIAAMGPGDENAVVSSIGNAGVTVRPLVPVHGKAERLPDGALVIDWIRRSRGAWGWLDEVDAPLNEPEELWEVSLGPISAPVRLWQTASARLQLTAAQLAELAAATDHRVFSVRQVGRMARSLPLAIAAEF